MTQWNSPKTGFFRARFLLQSAIELKQQLRRIGSDLWITVGQPEEVIPSLNPNLVLASQEPTHEESMVANRLSRRLKQSSGAVLQTIWQHTLYHIDDIPY